jgi:histidine triad (HIT) family protein
LQALHIRLPTIASSPGCIFCKIVVGELPSAIVDSDEHTLAFMDIAPATRGHALVIPRKHYSNLLEIPDAELERTMLAARRLAARMQDVLEPDGFNILNSCGPAAWQTVFHFHVHVVPRYDDDPLQLPWIPAQGDSEQIARVAGEIRGDG